MAASGLLYRFQTVLEIYWSATGLDRFSDKKSVVLVCGLQKWSSTILIRFSRLHPISTQRSPPILSELTISLPKSLFYHTNHKHEQNRLCLITLRILFQLDTTHDPSTRPFSILISPTEHPVDSPSAHFTPTHPKVV